MALLLRTLTSPPFPNLPSLVRTHQASCFFSTAFHLPITTTNSRTTSTLTLPIAQNLINEQQRCSGPNFIQKRNFNFYSFFRKKKSPEEHRKSDKLEPHYELVYSAHSLRYVQIAYGGVQAVAVSFLVGMAGALWTDALTNLVVLQDEPLEVATVLTFNAFICIGILRVCYWYPLRIYYSELEDQFVAVFLNKHPFDVRHVTIQPGQVKPKPPNQIVGAVLPWSHALYSSPSQTIHLAIENFAYPLYFNKMLGYVK